MKLLIVHTASKFQSNELYIQNMDSGKKKLLYRVNASICTWTTCQSNKLICHTYEQTSVNIEHLDLIYVTPSILYDGVLYNSLKLHFSEKCQCL